MTAPSREGLPRLDDAVVRDDDIAQEAYKYEAAHGEVYEELRRRGLPVDELVNNTLAHNLPPFPQARLQELGMQSTDSAAYNEIYDDLLHWQSHLLTLVAEAKNSRLAYEDGCKTVEALTRRGLLPHYKAKLIGSQEELGVRVDSHPEVRRMGLGLLMARQKENMVQAYLSRVESMLRAVSRHITLRGQDMFLQPPALHRQPEGERGTPRPSPYASPFERNR